jgi:hypothetical protein
MKRHTFLFTLILLLLASAIAPHPATADVRANRPAAPAADPIVLASDAAVDFDVFAPRLFWRDLICTPRPPSLAAADAPAAPAAYYFESIRRVAALGSEPRRLYDVSADAYCGEAGSGSLTSNLVADASHIYFATADALVRLPAEANPGDAAEILSSGVRGDADLAQVGGQVWALNRSGGFAALHRVTKSTGAVDFALLLNEGAHDLTAATAGLALGARTLVMWREGGTVNRYNATTGGVDVIGLNVTHYTAEGQVTTCDISGCSATSYVFMSTGTQIWRFNNSNGQTVLLYDTGDANTTVSHLVADGQNFFFFETYREPCGGFVCPETTTLKRRGRGAAGETDTLLIRPGDISSPVRQLRHDGAYLFWREASGQIVRFPKNAAALPVVNLRVTGMRVVQAVQDANNSVGLIERKRTFVRVLVRSDAVVGATTAGATTAVPNVRATLARVDDPAGQKLLPINAAGPRITVLPTPDITAVEQAFLFELPWAWTTGQSQLIATVNPYRAPLEPDYGDNTGQVNVSFLPSPRLSVEFFRLNYTLGGTFYAPRLREDVLATYSWLLRAYPLGGALGENFRPRLWDVSGGNQLGAWVQNSVSDCDSGNIGGQADRQLCAAFYTNGWLQEIRDDERIPNTTGFYYGMISDAAGPFPRGLAFGGTSNSVGPVGNPANRPNMQWDTDTTFGDWYAGHEIAHNLGRGHPAQGNWCGHSADDPGYPYAGAAIGPGNGSVEGFDAGDPAFGIRPTLLPDNIWTDMLGYCQNQWVSPYTYNALLVYMTLHPSAAQATLRQAQGAQTQARQAGPWLAVTGGINETAGVASFSRFRRMESAANLPALVPGPYAIRQRSAAGVTLAEDAFSAHAEDDGDALSFNQIVTLAAGARSVQIVRTSDGRVLANRALSAAAPVVTDVALAGAPDPVAGVVTLTWSASDADSDPLTFSVLYSRDGGATFQPVQMGVTGASTAIDTAPLGGSADARFRVVAHDGFHTGEADSPAFVMAAKAPEVIIQSPADGTRIQYGQLINFSGAAFDAQDRFVADGGLVWQDAFANVIGTGALVSADVLRVGVNVITLTATNSAGESASASVTITVGDDLAPAGPMLAVSPGALGWHVAAGSTAAQSGALSISNAGGGDLNWTAESDQPWLTLGAAAGTIAEGANAVTLGVQANPSGLPDGDTALAHVTIHAGAAGSITLPVSLSKGFIWAPPPVVTPPGGQRVFLPLVER